jgi:hypothetical protein
VTPRAKPAERFAFPAVNVASSQTLNGILRGGAARLFGSAGRSLARS